MLISDGISDVGATDLEELTALLADTSWGSGGEEVPTRRLVEAGLDPHNGEIERLHRFVGELLQASRHLLQHVGGFLLTEGRLDELVPTYTAAQAERTFIEWDNSVIETLGLMEGAEPTLSWRN